MTNQTANTTQTQPESFALPHRIRCNGHNWTLWNTEEFAGDPSYMIEQRHSWSQLKPVDAVNALIAGDAQVLQPHNWQADAPVTIWRAK